MTSKELIKALPAPVKPEEVLIYNFLHGQQVYDEQPVKAHDLYMQALLVYLAEQFKKHQQPTETPKRIVKKTKE